MRPPSVAAVVRRWTMLLLIFSCILTTLSAPQDESAVSRRNRRLAKLFHAHAGERGPPETAVGLVEYIALVLLAHSIVFVLLPLSLRSKTPNRFLRTHLVSESRVADAAEALRPIGQGLSWIRPCSCLRACLQTTQLLLRYEFRYLQRRLNSSADRSAGCSGQLGRGWSGRW